MLQLLNSAIPAADARARCYFLEIEGTGALRDRFGYAALEYLLTDAGRQLGTLAGDASGRAAQRQRLPDPCRRTRGQRTRSLGTRPCATASGGIRSTSTATALRLRALVGYAPLSHGFDDAGSALAAAERALREARATSVGIAAYAAAAAGRQQPRNRRCGPPGHRRGALRARLPADRRGRRRRRGAVPDPAAPARHRRRAARRRGIPAGRGSRRADARHRPAGCCSTRSRCCSAAGARTARCACSCRSRRARLAREGYADWLIEAHRRARRRRRRRWCIDLRLDDALIHAVDAAGSSATAMVPAGVQFCLSQYRAGDEADALLAQLPLGLSCAWPSRYATRLDDGPICATRCARRSSARTGSGCR